MAKKIVQGNDTYDLLIDIIFSLSPKQATALAKELVVRYTSRGRIKRYNAKGTRPRRAYPFTTIPI